MNFFIWWASLIGPFRKIGGLSSLKICVYGIVILLAILTTLAILDLQLL